MDEVVVGKITDVTLQNNVNQLAEAIKDMAKQIQGLQQGNSEESERLGKFKEAETLLEFTLVTGGFIRGTITWIGDNSLGVKTDAGQDVILYKHALAFVQKQAAE